MNDFTQVELVWLKKRIENWIRFGRIVGELVLDRDRRLVSFAPLSVTQRSPDADRRVNVIFGEVAELIYQQGRSQ